MPPWKANHTIQEFQATMSFAIDVNILLYASDTGSPHFERARSFIESCIAQKEVFRWMANGNELFAHCDSPCCV